MITEETETLLEHGKIYIKPSQKYEDLRSSASAFALVGGGITIFSALCWLKVINLPMQGASGILFHSVLTVMGLGSLAGAFLSYRSAGRMKQQVGTEEDQTKALIEWFAGTYPKEELDKKILSEFPDLSEGELTLKRFELIQDYLIIGHDLPDQAYVDALCEEIYQKLYE